MLRRPAHAARLHRARGVALLAALGLAAASASDAAALVAACPDGSVVFAPRWQDVHCAGAALVAPGGVPRLGLRPPEPSLARRQALRAQRESAREREIERQLTAALSRGALLPAVSAGPVAPPGADLQRGLAGRLGAAASGAGVLELELRGARPARLRIAHAPAFERHVRAGLAARGVEVPGPVLVFALAPAAAAAGVPVPAFAQGGVTLRPDASDPAQLGWLDSGPTALGYVALPARFDLARPVVVFWGDAVAAAQLRPGRPGAQRSASPTSS
jgi:hypothetical protein